MSINGVKVKKNDEWSTPIRIFNELNEEFGFTLDVCANDQAPPLCERFYSPEQDGLAQTWEREICFMNPPYSNVSAWVKKAYEESLKGALVVSLTFAKTDTIWFHEYCMKGEVRFLKGRIYFSDKGRAPCGSMITIFRPHRIIG